MKKAMNQSTMTMILNIGSGVLLILVFLLLISIFNLDEKADEANIDRFDLTYNANRFMSGSAYLTNEVRAFAATGDETHYENYWNEVNNLKNREAGIAQMQEIGITEAEQDMIDEMSSLSNTLVQNESDAMDDRRAGQADIALEAVYGKDYSDTIDKISELKTAFLKELDERSLGRVEKYQAQSTYQKTICFFLVVVLGAVQILSQVLIRIRVIKPIKRIKDEMEEISKGNLSFESNMAPDTSEIGMLVNSMLTTKTTLQKYIRDISEKLMLMANRDMQIKIDMQYVGDFAPIRDSLEQIVDALNEVLSKINASADVVTFGAGQISNGMQSLSAGAGNQLQSVEKLVEAVAGITDISETTRKQVVDINDMTMAASGDMGAGNVKLKELTDAIDRINKKSGEIGKIIKTIEDIAFQTNILALNAAVEAARAGAAGKGFAVVADEVRNLANKSAEAASNTTVLIEDTLAAVSQGSDLAVETEEAMGKVAKKAQKVCEIAVEILKSAELQVHTTKDFQGEIQNISEVVQLNASTAENLSAVSEEFNSHAGELRNQVSAFQLRDVREG